jgi:hypothetical protein
MIEPTIYWVAYDPATGAIRFNGHCVQSQLVSQNFPGLATIEGQGAYDTHYVAAGLVHAREMMPGEIVGTTIRGLPTPCRLHVDGQEYNVDDGVAEFTFTYPGTYKVTAESVYHLTKTFELIQP